MKKILSTLIIILLGFTIPASFSQEISVAEKAEQKSVTIEISEDGNVHVIHVVKSLKIPKQVELIDGVKQNLSVHNEEGEEKQHGVVGENDAILVLPSSEDVIIEYDLKEALELKENVWTWDFRYLESTAFIFPSNVDLVFANDRPVYLGEREGMMCHGCQMILEYSIDEPKIIRDASWEDRDFKVVLRTHAEINNFIFDQPSKSISFQVEPKNGFVTTIIPLELLWEPYQVYLDDEKIFFNKYINNGTHVWLNFRPDTSGEITIIGTTVVPEFPVALLVLSVSIITIIPLARKFNLR